MIGDTKFVHYDEYCTNCEYRDEPMDGEHCDECLSVPVVEDSHRPVVFKAKD